MMNRALLLAAFAANALATPAFGLKQTCYVDTFDDKTGSSVPEANPVGTYHDLQYIDWDTTKATAAQEGYVPHSPPNTASASFNQNLMSLNGNPLNPHGAIAIQGAVKSFDLDYFYFACQDATGQTLVSVGESCVLSVTGYYVNGGQAPEATFAFSVTDIPNTPMSLAKLPSSYVGLKNVTVGVASAAVGTTTTIIAVDNVAHCNYY